MSDELLNQPQEEQSGYLAAQQVEIKYTFARFHRRVFANLVDFIVAAVLFVALFVGIRAIVVHTPAYMEQEDKLISIRLGSGLYYRQESGNVIDIVSYLDEPAYSFSAYTKMVRAEDAVDQFIAYIEEKEGVTKSQAIQEHYDEYRLRDTFVYQDIPYFVKEGDKVEFNLDCKASYESYYTDVYAPYIDKFCQTFLVTDIPEYLGLVRFESTMLFVAELLPAYALAPILAYMVPMLCFRRGRMTLGKALYHIGIIDDRLLVATPKRTLARFFIFYGAEWLLTPFTFAIPFLISATLMAVSKKHQGFPDYLLHLYEVDTTDNKLYFSREEILFSKDISKQAVAFQPTYED